MLQFFTTVFVQFKNSAYLCIAFNNRDVAQPG